MKLLLIGDLHFKYNDDSNIQDLEQLSQKLIQIAESILNLNKIIILGDTLDSHEKINISQLTRAIKLLENLCNIAPIVILIGNHDRLNADEFLTDQSPFYSLKRWKNTIVADTVILEEIDNFKFIYMPYVPKGRFIEAIETRYPEEIWKSSDLIFAHQDYSGAIDNNNYKVEGGDIWSINYPKVYSGHIHKYQKLESGITYVGTPYQTRFGECVNKHVLLLEISKDKNLEIKEIYIPTEIRKKIKKAVDFAELKHFKLAEEDKDCLIKLSVTCKTSEAKKVRKMKHLKELKNVSIKIDYIEENTLEVIENNKVCDDKNNFFNELEKIIDDKQLFWLKKLI